MRTQRAGHIDIDPIRLKADLDAAEHLPWSDAYSDYVFGGLWKSCMLYAPGGSSGDGVVTNYDTDRGAAFTELAQKVPYISELIASTAQPSRLNFARLAKVANSVIIPHRDLLELDDIPEQSRNAHRLHIPLLTHPRCFFSDEDTVYRMRNGEIWFLDASRLHSVAVFTDSPRIHLMLDFVDGTDYPLLAGPGTAEPGIPEDSTIQRPPLPETTRSSIRQLADLITHDTIDEIFSIVLKNHYTYDGGPNFVWDMMLTIAKNSGNADVVSELNRRHRHYTLERSVGELTMPA